MAIVLLCLLCIGCQRNGATEQSLAVEKHRQQNKGDRSATFQQPAANPSLNTDRLEITFFWAPWSPESREYLPELESLAARYPDDLKINLINIDNNAQWAGKWNITNLPAAVFLKNGELIDKASSLRGTHHLNQFVIEAMESASN